VYFQKIVKYNILPLEMLVKFKFADIAGADSSLLIPKNDRRKHLFLRTKYKYTE